MGFLKHAVLWVQAHQTVLLFIVPVAFVAAGALVFAQDAADWIWKRWLRHRFRIPPFVAVAL